MTDTDLPVHFKVMLKNVGTMMSVVPWATKVGFSLKTLERGRAIGVLPYREELIGDRETGVIHGGAVTSMLDNLCGTAVVSALDEFKSTATLDLRIDYMRPAEKDRDLIGEAECYHFTRTIAFVRAWAYHETREKVVATAAGSFALQDPARWKSHQANMMKKDAEGGTS
ncbi:MAG: PaaI family thioesterase [Pseudomonadota bacterium]